MSERLAGNISIADVGRKSRIARPSYGVRDEGGKRSEPAGITHR
jgi:hypothetical protein